MSEFMNLRDNSGNLRFQLLTTVCAAVLLVSVADDPAEASESQPAVWIEVGAQLEKIGSEQQPFAPPFTLVQPQPAPFSPISPLQAQTSPRHAMGGEGKITFAPEDSPWSFTAAVRYGRSNAKKHIHQQTSLGPQPYIHYGTYLTPTVQNFADTKSKQSESHAILDFQVGRDVGLGIFGRSGSSTISAGVRFAQFGSHSNVSIYGHPDVDVRIIQTYGYVLPFKYFHNYLASADIRRSFHGIGPSLSWSGETPFAGNADTGSISLDWGVNGAVLFGRQKVNGTHSTTGYYFNQKYGYGQQYVQQYRHANQPIHRSRSVVVPNVGGFAAISFRRGDAKLTFGYRADFFIGAMDDGVVSRHDGNRSLHGPYASISVGL
jgi:hypothetical protein